MTSTVAEISAENNLEISVLGWTAGFHLLQQSFMAEVFRINFSIPKKLDSRKNKK